LDVGCSSGPGEVFLAAADLDRDSSGIPGEEHLDIILVTASGWVFAFDGAGNQLPGWGRKVADEIVAPPAIADVNDDGYLEIVLNDGDYHTRILLRNGTRLEGWPNRSYGCSLPQWDDDFYPADPTIPVPSPLVMDLDGDGRLEVVQGSRFECVTGWEPSGERMDGFPVTLGGGCSASAVGDIDGDGRLELVAGGGEGYMYGFLHPDILSDCLCPWRSVCFDRARNCVYPEELMPPWQPTGDRLLVENSFHAFPNPATTGVITFTFKTETGGRGTIDVYDISGVKVKSVGFSASPPQDGPQVDMTDLGNGLYICKLNLESNDQKAGETFKLAIKR
jgi:hypothetical protein